jgi:alpha-beta hydrolase superfamily lysophospholipase
MNNFSVRSSAVCQRIPFWLNEQDDAIFCWLHLPNNNQIKSMGAVICNPLGYEYSHSHRSLRHLADQLAAVGYPSIRFDYHGTGDSFSDLLAENRIQTFLLNIEQAINQLQNLTGIQKVSLVGLRLGATLAAAYAKNNAIENLVLWSPYVKGRAYVREMKALEQLASHASEHKNNFIDSGGFIVSDETADKLSKINLLKQNYHTENILLIEREDLQPNQKLFDALIKNIVTSQTVQNTDQLIEDLKQTKKIERFAMSGYLEMMAEPQQTIVPQNAINNIISWLDKKHLVGKSDTLDKKLIASQNLKKIEQLATMTALTESPYQEVLVNEESSFGVLTLPANYKQSTYKKPVIILCNSGSVHRIGPNRVYVELARVIAELGFAVYRFDLRQLGDSVNGILANENNPYSNKAVDDIENAIKEMQESYGFSDFIISGLCSGAHNTFHAGLALSDKYNIQEAIIINPLTFYKDIEASQSEYSKDNFSDYIKSKNTPAEQKCAKGTIDNFQIETDAKQYKKSLLDPKKWLKLLSGKVDIGYLIKFITQKSIKALKTQYINLGVKIGLTEGDRLSQDLQKYHNNNLAISFFIASKDPGKAILMSQSKNTVKKMLKAQALNIYDVPNADHTFSSYQCRKDFVESYKRHLIEKYSQ